MTVSVLRVSHFNFPETAVVIVDDALLVAELVPEAVTEVETEDVAEDDADDVALVVALVLPLEVSVLVAVEEMLLVSVEVPVEVTLEVSVVLGEVCSQSSILSVSIAASARCRFLTAVVQSATLPGQRTRLSELHSNFPLC
jgi:hypothetical protein